MERIGPLIQKSADGSGSKFNFLFFLWGNAWAGNDGDDRTKLANLSF
jgi:hypothetical protein